MSSIGIASDLPDRRAIPRQWIVTGGQILLGLALLGAWEWGARAFGPLFFAPPLATAQRIVEMAMNGKLLTDTIATLRVSALVMASASPRRHSGAGRRPEPGIQRQPQKSCLDSGFALSARPGMTTRPTSFLLR